MKLAKTSSEVSTSNNGGAVVEAQKLVVKINNLLRNGADPDYHPEYFLDLMGEEVVQRFGREQLEEAVRQVTKADDPLAELSAKFTTLARKFNELYFDDDPRLRELRVEVRYWLGWPPIETTGGGEIAIVASCEPVMVRQLLTAMAFHIDQEFDPCHFNELYLNAAGAPIWVEPSQRHLPTEEFVTAATHEPDHSIKEEWLDKLRKNRPAEGEPVSDVIHLWQRGGRR